MQCRVRAILYPDQVPHPGKDYAPPHLKRPWSAAPSRRGHVPFKTANAFGKILHEVIDWPLKVG